MWSRFSLEPFTLWGGSKLAKMTCSGSLTLRFANNEDGKTETICSTVHACVMRYSLDHRTLCGMHLCELHLEGSSSLLLHHGYVHWDSHYRTDYRVSTALAAASSRRESCYGCCQPGERLCCVRLPYGCCISQERSAVPVVPVASWVAFHPLSLCLAYPGFCKQYKECK